MTDIVFHIVRVYVMFDFYSSFLGLISSILTYLLKYF